MYVLEGSIWARCGDDRFELEPRSFVFLPRDVPHEWDVVGDEAVVLIVTAPAGLEEFLEGFHGGEDRADLAARYGIEFGVSDDADRPYIAENARELERMRRIVDRLDDETLESAVNEYWTVAGVLGHIAFWDARVLSLAGKLDRGEPFAPTDTDPEDVDWINDASRPLIHAVPARELAALSLQIGEETDALVATLPPDRLWPLDPESPLYAVRAEHRGEHLDEIEAALRSRA